MDTDKKVQLDIRQYDFCIQGKSAPVDPTLAILDVLCSPNVDPQSYDLAELGPIVELIQKLDEGMGFLKLTSEQVQVLQKRARGAMKVAGIAYYETFKRILGMEVDVDSPSK